MPGLSIGVIQGGPTPLFQMGELIGRAMQGMESSRRDVQDWSVNVVFIIPGRLSRPDFVGIRTGKFDRQAQQLMVQVAVPDRPFEGWEEMARFVLDGLEAATKKAEDYFRLEGLDVNLGEAWGQISALRHELELRPLWAVNLPAEPVDDVAPQARAVLDALEARRAAAAPIRAELRLLSTDDGGRHFPITDGHCTDCGSGVGNGGVSLGQVVLYIEEKDRVDPGHVGMVRLHPVSPERWTSFDVGSVIEILEGPRVIGEVTLVEVLRRS
jgi:hypothetical protein